MLCPAFHFHSVLLIFVTLWPISTLCVADMVHDVADMVCGRYRLVGEVDDILTVITFLDENKLLCDLLPKYNTNTINSQCWHIIRRTIGHGQWS